MLDRGELAQVVADLDMASRLIASAKRHLRSAELVGEEDPELAYAAIHDAARKAMAAMLQAQGLRPTTAGENTWPYNMPSKPSSVRPWAVSCDPSTESGPPATAPSTQTGKPGSTPSSRICPRHNGWSMPPRKPSNTSTVFVP
jgi:hypothetical protein